jgi:vitamin B12 transporter
MNRQNSPRRRGIATAILPLAALYAMKILAVPTGALAQVSTAPEMVVSASRIPVPAEAVGSAVTVIRGDTIARRQDAAVADSLRTVPGLAVNRTGGFGANSQVRIRGSEGNQTLVIVDGIEIGDPANGSEYDFGDMLAYEIDRIEVLRGPQSALWGSDAIGGVVNIVTRPGRGDPEAGAAVEVGSFDTRSASASYRRGNPDYHFSVFGTGAWTHGVSAANAERGNSETDGYQNQTVHVKAGFNPAENLEVGGVFRATDAVTDTDGFTSTAVDRDNHTNTLQRYGRGFGTLSLLDGRWIHTASVASTISRRDNLQNKAENSTFQGRKHKFDYQTTYSFDVPDALDSRHSITLAAEKEKEFVDAESSTSNVHRVIHNKGYVVEYRLDLLDRIFLSAAGRHDDADFFSDSDTYRLTAAYAHETTATRAHASIGTGIKNPTLFELFGFTATFTGNPNLRPESAFGWDAGVEQALGEDAVVDVTFFHNEIDDLINGSGNTAVNLVGVSKINGIETTASYQLSPDVRLNAAYTWSIGEDASGRELVRRPKHVASAAATYDFDAWQRPATLTVGVNFHGERTDNEFDAAFNTTRVTLESYSLVRVASEIELRPGLSATARIENLLDQSYEESLSFGSTGRGIFAGLRARF